jgi:hypothetical protein
MIATTFRTLIATLCLIGIARAEVTRVEILSRSDVPGPGYERITGRVHFAVDPANPRNQFIADLDKAARTAAGRVEFSADFWLLKPKSGGSGSVLVDVVNRGNPTVWRMFNRASGADPVGDGFLMKRGFAIAAVGWEFDIPAAPDVLSIRVPNATDRGKPIQGIVRASFSVEGRTTSVTLDELSLYRPVDPTRPDTMLTKIDGTGARTLLPRTQWKLSGNVVTVPGGFEAGRTYEVAYLSSNPPIGGLGFLAVRDFASWLRFGANSLAPAKYVHAFGSSQTGRFLRTFIYQGFNSDEQNRQVFDGVIANIAGAARLDLNARWAVPAGSGTPATAYPFSDAAQRDPVSGASDGTLDNPRARANQPKIFYTNSSVEYWSRAGRAAALVHTTPDGRQDIELPSNVRFYFFAGTQHGPAAFPPERTLGRQKANPNDYRWALRALFVAMDEWVRNGTAPPASRHPRRDSGTLVDAAVIKFPALPSQPDPRSLSSDSRGFNSFLKGGGGEGTELPLLVSQVNEDGNETAGIRLPDLAVPLATYTGWNFRSEQAGAADQLVGLVGSYIPFAPTAADSKRTGDPRRAISERYASRAHYQDLVRKSALELAASKYVLSEDVDAIVKRAMDHWDLLTTDTN